MDHFQDQAKTLFSNFEKESGSKVIVHPVSTTFELIQYILSEADSIDLILGIDNSFSRELSIQNTFVQNTSLDMISFFDEALIDKDLFLVPYAYSSLALVYDADWLDTAPESFGELQDAQYYNQLGLCDPVQSSIGRACLHWSVALFGEAGYQQLWRSLRKNVLYSYPSWQASLNGLKNGECKMIFGFIGTAAWNESQAFSTLNLQTTRLREGSFLYVETAAIPKNAKHKEAANSFIHYLLEPNSQTLLSSKLGLFPVNNKATMPSSYLSLPYTSYTVNDRLRNIDFTERQSEWLAFWNRMFYNTLSPAP